MIQDLYKELQGRVLGITGGTVDITGTTTAATFQHTMVWNNQLDSLIDSDDYSIPFPSVLIELGQEGSTDLSLNYTAIDMVVRFHIIQDYYNGDNMSENLTIFELRDQIIKTFSNYQPCQGGFLNLRNEYQDYSHTNLYHYVVEYVFHYIDNTAVKPDYYAPTGTTITIIPDIIINI